MGGPIFLLLISLFLYAPGTLAEEALCSDNLRDLAAAHLALQEDPIAMLDSTLAAVGAGAVAGAGEARGRLQAQARAQVTSKQQYEHLRQMRRQYQSKMGEFTRLARSMGMPNVYGPYQLSFAINGRTNNRAFPISTTQVDAGIQRLATQYRMDTSDPQKMSRLRQLLAELYPMQVMQENIEREQQKRYRILSRRFGKTRLAVGAIRGGLLGLGLDLGGRYLLLKAECGDYGVAKLINHFSASMIDGEKQCFLSDNGAIAILQEEGEAERLCRDYPQIGDAVAHSFDNYLDYAINQMAEKQDPIEAPQITCHASQPQLEVRVDGTMIKIEYVSSQEARFEFEQTGWGKSHNQGRLLTEDARPVFDNHQGIHLTKNIYDSDDYLSLVNYFLSRPSAPRDPTLKRRYLTGAALSAIQSYRDDHQAACAAATPDVAMPSQTASAN